MLLLVCAAGGCGPRVGQVEGKVTLEGRPVPSADVAFHYPDRTQVASTTAADGTYVITGAPVGTVKVTVTTHARVPDGLMKIPGTVTRLPDDPANRAVDIPPRYGKLEETDLTFTVTRGSQKYPIDLKNR
jgi:hypothetical protein